MSTTAPAQTVTPAPAVARASGVARASAEPGHPAGGLPGTDIRSAGEAELIPLLRTQIDAIDAGIARLVAERARLSRRVQSARMAAGGVRVELGRERRIVQTYRDALGEDGIGLGTAVLRLCRGPL